MIHSDPNIKGGNQAILAAFWIVGAILIVLLLELVR